jgi:hypothetical protein
MVGVLCGGIWETGDSGGNDAAEDGRDRMVSGSIEASYWFVPGKLGVMGRMRAIDFKARPSPRVSISPCKSGADVCCGIALTAFSELASPVGVGSKDSSRS